MKRDMDLIRNIFLALENDTLEQSKAEDKEYNYNLAMLIEEGYVIGVVRRYKGGAMTCYAGSLTWKGHELLDAMRDITIWDKFKLSVQKVGGSVPIPVLTQVLSEIIKKSL